MAWLKTQFCYVFLLIMLLAGTMVGQTTSLNPTSSQDPTAEKSLGQVARDAKKARQSAAKTVTQEDMDAKNPFPALNMEGVDNSAEVITAMTEYTAKHSKDETEDAVHAWYDRYDAMLAAAIHDNEETRKRRESTNFTGYQLCMQSPSYENCEARRQAEIRGARADSFDVMDNMNLIARIQQAFMKVRGGIQCKGMRYDWFHIRNANGNGSY